MNEPVVAFDLTRMFIGDEPPLFLLEIAARTIFIYLYTLFLIRWIGSRSIGQLSLVEFLLVIALGSAVGDAMFYPEVPIVHAMAVITVVVLLDKCLSFLVARKPRLEDAIEGKSYEVVCDGVINWKRLLRMNVGHDELFEQLRLNHVSQLGEVRGAYFETNGILSVFTHDKHDSKPGLGIVPPWDVREPPRFAAGQQPGQGRPGEKGTGQVLHFACIRCGTVVECGQSALPRCPHCDGETFQEASS